MRKILISLVLLTIFAAPLAALAAPATGDCCTLKRDVELKGDTKYTKGTIVGAEDGTCSGSVGAKTSEWGIICLLGVMTSIVDWTFTLFLILAIFMVIMGAWTIITAGGTPANVTKGKDFILYAAIGLAVAFLAKALPSIVKSIAGL